MSLPMFIVIGVALLLLLSVFLRQGKPDGLAAKESVLEPAEEADLPDFQLPARALMDRILDAQDFEFVLRHSPAIGHMLLRERRRIALSWLLETRRQAGRLMAFHLRTVRWNVRLNPVAEARLALHFTLFQLVYVTMFGLILLGGPLRTRSLVSRGFVMADGFSLLLKRLEPRGTRAPVQAEWGG